MSKLIDLFVSTDAVKRVATVSSISTLSRSSWCESQFPERTKCI
jgi:hypothetical protein